ncbi:MAG: indole-3-glycerol-phosphate synthase [Fidelibacterota bacterium]|nr:MAG: indole-3-glycerol-phosphate synthase [Candidatus Neomarinimicrobiota bacterium]
MTSLSDIVAHKLNEVKDRQKQAPMDTLTSRTFGIRDFAGGLTGESIQVIAEVKRKSPSIGDIRTDLDPTEIARAYEQAGAAAISVITDETFFGGCLGDLTEVRAGVSIPVLRKDFILHKYQVYESFHAGADAILLIADALSLPQLEELYRFAQSLSLQVLIEGHSQEALATIRQLKPALAGINSRNLATMEVDLEATLQRRYLLPDGAIHVAESGIRTSRDLARVSLAGYDAALIGTALLIEDDPGMGLQRLLNDLTLTGTLS